MWLKEVTAPRQEIVLYITSVFVWIKQMRYTEVEFVIFRQANKLLDVVSTRNNQAYIPNCQTMSLKIC